MKLQLPRVLLLVLAGLLIVGVGQFREELVKVPRIRVGPLDSDEPAAEPLRLFVIGDTGTGGETQQRVAQAMEKRCLEAKPSGILLLGDNFYQAGVESVEDPQWQTKLLDPYGSECLSQLPIYPVLGNHDYRGNPSAQIEFSLVNRRWRFPNRFYTVRFGDLLRLVAYDTQVSELCFRPAYCSVDFLLHNVRRQDAAWTIAMGHHPLRSASLKQDGGGHRGGLRGYVLTPLLCDHADIYLAGHAHHMEHRRLDGCRMELVIAGGGGADLYGVSSDPESLFAQSINGFAELELTRAELTVRFLDVNAAILHEARKQK
jgi:acid phosphatase